MKNRSLLIFLMVVCVGCSDKNTKKEVLSKDEQTTVKEAKFSKYTDRGFAFGKDHKDEIQKQIKVWSELIQEELHLNQEELYDYVITNTGLIQACEKFAPELLLEVRGMAKGADIPYKSLVNLNIAEEIILHFSQGYQSCTNIGVKTPEANYLAYNLDLPEFFRINEPYVIKENQQIIYGFPGILATGGMNRYFALTTNSLPNNSMDENGLPLPFMLRKLLNTKSIDAAKQLLETIPLATPQNLMFVSRSEIIDLECSKNQIIDATQDGPLVYHTNFAIKNDDIIREDKETCQRYTYLEQVSKSQNINELTTKSGLTELLENKTPSTILSEETYISFIAVFPSDAKKPPEFHLLPTKYNPNATLIKL